MWVAASPRAALALAVFAAVAAGALAASDPTASAACIANPSAPIDDPPAFPSAYLGGCKQCSADGSACVECWKWFGLAANGMCVECPRNGPEGSEYICLDCDGDEPSVCKECIENTETPIVPGLFADEEGRCTKCGEGCVSCLNGNGTCVACDDGLGLIDDECKPCSSKLGEGCASCDGDVERCSRPAFGFSLDAKTSRPFACDLPSCESCASPTQCAACSYGYGLDKKGGKCVECRLEGCTECGPDADSCTACGSGGYRLADGGGSCEACADAGCSSCDAAVDRCEYCSESETEPKGPDPVTGACVKCLDAKCSACPSDASYCWSCAEGTRQDPRTGACVACTDGCATCEVDGASGQQKCGSCAEGYELQQLAEQPTEYSYISICVKKTTR